MTAPTPTPPTPPPTRPTKAIMGAVITLAWVLTDQVQAHGWGWQGILQALVAALVTGGGVYGVTNRPKDPQ